MYRNFIFSIVFGAFGITLLCCLGVWQLQRLEWKTQLLRNLEQRIVESPIELGEDLDEERDQYRSVVVSGILQDKEIHVLTSRKNVGPGFLVISPLRLLICSWSVHPSYWIFDAGIPAMVISIFLKFWFEPEHLN